MHVSFYKDILKPVYIVSIFIFVISMINLEATTPLTPIKNLKSDLVSVVVSSPYNVYLNLKGGISTGINAVFQEESDNHLSDDEDDEYKNIIEVDGSPNTNLNGQYVKSDNNINGLPHYFKTSSGSDTYHLYWANNQWIIHRDTDPTKNYDNLFAYSKSKVKHPLDTSKTWYIKLGKSYEAISNVVVTSKYSDIEKPTTLQQAPAPVQLQPTEELFGVPKKLIPLFIAFMLDSIAVGMAMPLLPFFVMELGAKALQLSFVVSSNYVVQMFGCLLMGNISDKIGRRFVLLCCLFASSLSYFCVSNAKSLTQVTIARIIVGSCGGLVPGTTLKSFELFLSQYFTLLINYSAIAS